MTTKLFACSCLEFLLSLECTAVDRVSQQLDRILPDFMLVFAVPILSNLPDFERTDDLEMLKKIQGALW